MNNPTDLMKVILQNETSQKIIDYISPLYGNSYVGLWLIEAIGTVLGEVSQISDQLRYETTPTTTDLLIDYWERQYGIQPDPSLTLQQRRNRILAITTSKTAVNPKVLEAAVSAALNGAAVEITENTAKNTFKVNVRDAVSDISSAIAVINQMKPAHLIYDLQVALLNQVEADIKPALVFTFGEHYELEVQDSPSEIGVYQTQNKLVILFGVTVAQNDNVLIIN